MAINTLQTRKIFGLRASVVAVASCLALSALPATTQAAGLGKIVVLSALGQPLRAEIELSASREELSGMKAQLATPEAFKQAGLDYASTLLGIRFSLDKRPSGASVIKLTSSSPINDPFIDMLLELNWPSGRLVREYTFLLDPPEVSAKAAAMAVAPVVDKAELSTGKTPVEPRAATPTEDAPAAPSAPAEAEAEAPKVRAPGSVPKTVAPSSTESHEVKRGDTLNKIASATKPEGVSLEQMLVGLLRANQDAFASGNMNRLKSGKILSVPEKSALEAISAGEAKKIVRAQSADWNTYRSKLAAIAAQSTVKESAAKQEEGGKITAKVEEKIAPAAERKDQVKVSRSETAGAKSGVAGKRSEEDLIAREKALNEANERVAMLEKNVNNLQKLVELKNQNLAELQKQAAEKALPVDGKKPADAAKAPTGPVAVPAPVTPPAKAEPVAPAPAVVPQPVDKAAEKAPETKPLEDAAKPEEIKPEPPVVNPTPEQKPDEMPKEKPKPKPLPPPPEEPSIVDELLDDPLVLAGGGGILALILAFFMARRRRQGEVPIDLSSTLSPPSDSLTGNSVFRSTGGQSVDTSHTPAQTDFSQAGPGSIDTDEVDPVAEADVYMAYGRDAQAEEILLEAKQKDPKRYAIHLKLLEIYANRKDAKQFETLATDLYSETSGIGPDWEKAAAMGLKLVPANPLFGGNASVSTTQFDADATVVVSSPFSVKDTAVMPGELSQIASAASPTPALTPSFSEPVQEKKTELTSLDFDLGLSETKTPAETAKTKSALDETVKLPEPVVQAGALDLNLAKSTPVTSPTPAAPAMPAAGKGVSGADTTVVGFGFSMPEIKTAESPVETANNQVADLDFDLGFGSMDTPVPPDSTSAKELPAADDGLEFDVNLTESTFLGRSAPDLPPFDMSAIDLDLKTPEIGAPQASVAVEPPAGGVGFDREHAATSVNPDFHSSLAETVVNPDFSMARDEPEFEITANEEVATKLDLAKAYEEMGDLEGARELLQEVMNEGDPSQREKAQVILGKIGA